MQQKAARTIVIIGGVAGGASAAARARRCNEHAHIIMYERDAYVSFANCGLPYYVGGEITDRSKLLVASRELFADRFRVEARTGHEVTSIDREQKKVTVRDIQSGKSFEQPYDQLIISTGASPIVPKIHGVDAANVYTLRNLDDADKLARYVRESTPTRAVVVGAGFIGLEMVEQLAGLGLSVSLVELADQVLSPLDAEMAKIVENQVVDRGVTLYLGDGLDSVITDNEQAVGIRLSSGAEVAADLVILGIGVRPNVAMAQACGLELGGQGGIAVDASMRTSDPNVYAVGDAVEYQHGVTGTHMRIALGGPANRAGRVAGENAATAGTAIGGEAKMAPVLGTAIVRAFDKTAGMTGLSTKAANRLGIANRAVIITAGHHAGYYPGSESMVLKLIYDPDTGRVLGASAVGGEGVDKRIDVIATAVHFGGTVESLCGLDLAYAPPFGSAKDPIHMAAFAASNDRAGFAPLAQIDDDLNGQQIVDVRTQNEFDDFRLPAAKLTPLHELRDQLDELDPNAPTVVVCHSGMRAHVGTRILKQHGFGNVRNLTGGMSMRRISHPDEIVHGSNGS